MVASSIRLCLSMRRCSIPGRARRLFLALLVASLMSLWMLAMQDTSDKTSSVKVDVQRKSNSETSVLRTNAPVRVQTLSEDGVGKMQSLARLEEEFDKAAKRPQRLPLEEEPVYRTAPKVPKETLEWVLVFLEHSESGRSLLNILQSHRFKVKAALVHENSWPQLTIGETGRFSVIIFESLRSYSHLSSVKTKVIDEYCQTYGIGLIILAQPEVPVLDFPQVRSYPLYLSQHVKLKDPIINENSGVPRITKANQRLHGNLPDHWITFRTNHSTYIPVMEAVVDVQPQVVESLNTSSIQASSKTCVVYDRGLLDGIKRIFFGYSVDQFLHMTLLLDSVALLTNGRLQTTLDRYVLIDIDDIFVGRTGIRLTEADVENMVEVQAEIRRDLVEGFYFNLGWSGKYFEKGTEEENAGDRKILELAKNFWWFPHMWDHGQPHLVKGGPGKLKELMEKNKQFAIDYKIPITKGYSVAPHHSGVYPVHEDLYDVWKEVWQIEATSTEEYPHLRPAHKRRGFIHKDIMVVPRETCSLYTKTNYFAEFRGGRQGLDALIQGGELFATLVSNPVNIFMTHMSNYGNDRLSQYTFKRAFQFLRTYTNLRLQTLPPVETAKKYFELYPEEKEPLWGNPCEDHRHLEIWAPGKDCTRLPNTLILGPQKTGTTALYTFLQMHKRIRSNHPSKETFEEVQFFNGANYYKGLDWYLDFFPSNTNRTLHIFEKSANYFDSLDAPQRVKALLPKAKLIVILLDPAKRAYSWYHHMRSHQDATSLQYSFHEVITADLGAPKQVRSLQKRCLEPGKYSTHLERWLQYFSTRQMLLVDGEQLKTSPHIAMEKVQKFLRIKPALNYSKLLKYDSKKGFFCRVGHHNRTHCLGPSKGRDYPDMDQPSAEHLKAYYRQENLVLATLLDKLNLEHPLWLHDQLNEF